MQETEIVLLTEIRDTLREILALSKQRTARVAAGGKPIAPDADLDGAYGDPIIKAADPRDWAGPSMKSRKFSECPAEYLDLLADRFEYFATKAEEEDKRTSAGKPVAPYNRKDAARARGWAARIRSGAHTPPAIDAAPGWAVAADADEPEVQY